MNPLSVLHVLDSLDPFGGASVACVRLATPTAKLPNFNVAIASHQPPQPWAPGTFDPFAMHLWKGEVDRDMLRSALEAADVVHLHGIWDPVLRLAGAICAALGKPYVLTPHGMLADWPMSQKPLKKRFYLATLGHRLLRDVHTVHFTAEQEREQSQPRLGHGRVWVAPLINDLSADLDASEHLSPRTPPTDPSLPATALFLSRLNNKKGPDRAIDMLRDLPNVELWIAGRDDPTYRAQLQQRAESIGVHDRIRWIGEVDEAEKRRLYQTAHVFVLPTHQENFGQVLVEAMANRLPVVTTRNVDIWRELESGGAVIAEETPRVFADAVRQLLGDPDGCADRSTRGHAFVRDWLNVEAGLKQYQAWYRAIATGQRA